MDSKISRVVFAILVHIQLCSAIKCYVCQHLNYVGVSHQCLWPWNYRGQWPETECPEHPVGHPAWNKCSVMQRYMSHEGGPDYMRACGIHPYMNRNSSGCWSIEYQKGYYLTECVCEGPLCNASPSLKLTTFLKGCMVIASLYNIFLN